MLPARVWQIIALALTSFATIQGQHTGRIMVLPAPMQLKEYLVGSPHMIGELFRPLNATIVYALQNTKIIRYNLHEPFYTTLAGNGLPGYRNGFGADAQFSSLHDFTFLPDRETMIVGHGGYYNRIRRINITSQEVTTIAGRGFGGGFQDGTGSVGDVEGTAAFNNPAGFAILPIAGGYTIIVADRSNHAIRTVDYGTGETTTLAGFSGLPGYTDGDAANVTFNSPTGLALMPDHSRVVVADWWNLVLRVVWLHNGTTYTLAGTQGAWGLVNGPGLTTRFDQPKDVAFLNEQQVLVADYHNFMVRLVEAATGESSIFAGLQSDQGYQEADIGKPEAVTVLDDGGQVLVSDSWQRTVRFINVSTRAITVPAVFLPIGAAADGVGRAANFRGLAKIDWSKQGAFGVVVDALAHQLKRVDAASRAVTTLYAPGSDIGVCRLSRNDRE
eukprot:1773530-Rhodomonas_salina.1